MFEKCTNCTTRVVREKRDDSGIFCSTICQNYYRHPGFCRACNAATTPQSAGSTITVNGIASKIYGSKHPCSVCGSKVQTKYLVVLFIPLIPLGRYRTKWASPGRYISRKLKSVKELDKERLASSATFHSTMGR